MMLKLKLQYFGHQMPRADSLEKTLMLGKTEGRRSSRQQRKRCLDCITSDRKNKKRVDTVPLTIDRDFHDEDTIESQLTGKDPDAGKD